MKWLWLLAVISLMVVGCFKTSSVKVKTPSGNYEFDSDTNGITGIVISNEEYVVEIEAETVTE